jgi:hypothetical protein
VNEVQVLPVLHSGTNENLVPVSIAAKFRGPPTSGNGGYVSGIFASVLTRGIHDLSDQRAAEVTLRAPTPLDVPLQATRANDALTVKHDDALIAEVAIKPLQLDVPRPPSWEEAVAAGVRSYSLPYGLNGLFDRPMRGVHPICFCCGTELSPEDGLHVYSASVKNGEQVAAAWVPNANWADTNGAIKPEFIWTALDCPGQMAWRARGIQTGMLGRLTARIERPVRSQERCVVIGWTLGNEGKKFFAGTALFDANAKLCAYAKAVWIGKVN